MKKEEYSSLVKEVMQLAKREAVGKKKALQLSPETAALLDSIGADGPTCMGKATSSQSLTADVGAKAAAAAASPPSVAASACPAVGQVASEPGEVDMAPVERVLAIPESSLPEVVDKSLAPEDQLACIRTRIVACQKCHLGRQRKNPVPGEGNPTADLVFVGEAPGEEEDLQGRPFVGRSGQLLTDIIVKGMRLRREDVFICNVLKCRPPENRTPNPEEVSCCEPYLLQQLDAMHPKVICALGLVAAQTLLKTKAFLRQLRGQWHNYHGIPLRVTYHPAYLLRNPNDKGKAWEDIQEVMRVLSGEIVPRIDLD